MPKIHFDNVEKHYGNMPAIAPLTLKLDDSEFTVLVGPSGCGKSTTLRLLAGLENLSAGEIFFDDKPISHLPSKSRDIAMVFQDYALYPHMNVAKNMSFAMRLQKASKADITKKVRDVATLLGIEHLLERKPSDLSGGQRQRVAMGRALVRDAATFLFDEPLSNLDAKLRAKMRTELAEMRDTLDKNMIYVTHDQVEAMTLGQRIVVMNDGMIMQQGTPEQLYKSPDNIFVAGFIGSPSMNFIPVACHTDGNQITLVGNDFSAPWHNTSIQLPNNHELILGFRPNNATIIDNSANDLPHHLVLQGHVTLVEYLGATSLAVVTCGGKEVHIEIPEKTRVAAKNTITFAIPYNDIYLFDSETGANIYTIQT